MNDERKNAEKRLWQSIARVAHDSGKEAGWEYLGYACSQKKIHDLVLKFHQDPRHPGFYGLRIPMGEVGGMKVSMILENQKELVIGIQTEEPEGNAAEPGAFDLYRDLCNRLSQSGRDWQLDSPGWLAWKTPEVRLNFRAVNNRAFQDIMQGRDNSEALYLITEEVTDLVEEISELIVNQKVVEYGTVAN